jgi:hypothetical protein
MFFFEKLLFLIFFYNFDIKNKIKINIFLIKNILKKYYHASITILNTWNLVDSFFEQS